MARLLALDVGEVRIGVAACDATGFLASPYTTLTVSRDENETWGALQQLIAETDAEGIVVGLPISLDGQIHAQAQRVQSFAERLRPHVTIPLTFWDERLSTVEAERLLAQRGGHPKRHTSGSRKQNGQRSGQRSTRRKSPGQGIDALAATVILQEYLDHLATQKKDRQL
jgi:putative Holliday junction resolvase